MLARSVETPAVRPVEVWRRPPAEDGVGIDAPGGLRVAAAFTELATAI